MKTILVVDDEQKIATLARDYLEHAGFAVLTANDGPSALTTIRQRRPDLHRRSRAVGRRTQALQRASVRRREDDIATGRRSDLEFDVLFGVSV